MNPHEPIRVAQIMGKLWAGGVEMEFSITIEQLIKVKYSLTFTMTLILQ